MTTGNYGESRTLRFGEFEFETDTRRLLKAGELVSLQQQPAWVLQLLAERAGEAVTREELRQRVWGDERFVDHQQGLNYCIKEIRRALEDSATHPKFLETIPRRGYRFVAPVDIVHKASPLSREHPARRPWGLVGWLGLILTLAALVIAAGWLVPRSPPEAEEKPMRVGILPFADDSLDSEERMLVNALAQELTSELGRRFGRAVGVIARTSSWKFERSAEPLPAIARALEADLLIVGRAAREKKALRLHVDLVRSDDGTSRWSNSYAVRPREADLLGLARRLTDDVATELGLVSSVPDPPPYELSLQAQSDYIRGLTFAKTSDPAKVLEARERLGSLVEAHPEFAPGYVAWASTGATAPPLTFWQVEEALSTAIDLDPNLDEAHHALAFLRFWRLYDGPTAEQSYREALRINPRLASARQGLGLLLSSMGRHEEAIGELKQALHYDPLSAPVATHLGWVYLFAGSTVTAIEMARHGVALDPTGIWGRISLIEFVAEAGDAELFLREASTFSGQPVTDAQAFWARYLEHPLVGGTAKAAAPLVRLDRDREAIAALLGGCRESEGWPLPFVKVDPRFERLRAMPEFDQVLECMGLDRDS